MTDPAALGTEARPMRVAIVGSGPSAFYAAEALYKADKLFPDADLPPGGLHVAVDMFDRLPTPYGLVRGGVAPDHQKIKEVVRVYEKIADRPTFRFFGNVRIGRDLTVAELLESHDRIVFAVGAESDRQLGVPGEDLDGIHSATSFVGWYNGHPDHSAHRFGLDGAKRVAVVGNGNVAMDVARVLLQRPAALEVTDIAEYALAELRSSTVEEVVLLGRRGPAQAAFSPKEIKEVANVEGAWLQVDPEQIELDPVSAEWLEKGAPRSAARNVDFLKQQSVTERPASFERRCTCRFLVSPVEFLGDGTRVRGVKLELGELHAGDDGTPRPKGLGEFDEIEVDLVFEAIGYRGIPLAGVPFDERSGTIPNAEGRVIDGPGGAAIPRQYVVGWAKRGPTGLIGTNSPDSRATVRALVDDLSAGGVAGEVDFVGRLMERGVDHVSFDDWRRLDAWERAEGEKRGKVRHKLSDVGEMMEVVRRLRPDVAAEGGS